LEPIATSAGPAAMLLATCKQIDTDSSYLQFLGTGFLTSAGPAAMLLATCKQIDTDSNYLQFSGKAIAPATCT